MEGKEKGFIVNEVRRKNVKNDKIDATVLLEALVEGMLTAVYVPSAEDVAIRELTCQRKSIRWQENDP